VAQQIVAPDPMMSRHIGQDCGKRSGAQWRMVRYCDVVLTTRHRR